MSKILFSQEAIDMLKKNKEVTYTSDKSISFTSEFRSKIYSCGLYDILQLRKTTNAQIKNDTP